MQAIRHVQDAPGFPAALDAFLQAHAEEPSPPLSCHQVYALSAARLSDGQRMSLGRAMLRADTRHSACSNALEAILRNLPKTDMMDLLDAYKAKDPSQTQRWERSELTQLNQIRFAGDIEGAKAYLDRVGQNPSKVSAQLLGEIAYLRHTPGLREDVAAFFLAALRETDDAAKRSVFLEYWLQSRQDGDHPDLVDAYLAENFPRNLRSGILPDSELIGKLLAHAKAKGTTENVLQVIRENQAGIAKADLLQRLSQAVRKTDPELGLSLIEKAWTLEKKTNVLRSLTDALAEMQRNADILALLTEDALPGTDWQRDLLPKRIQALVGLKEWDRMAEETLDYERRFPQDKQRQLQRGFETLVKEGQYEAAEALFVLLAPSLETAAKDDARRAGLLLKAATLYQALDDAGGLLKATDDLMANTRFRRAECDTLAKVLADFTRHRPEITQLPVDDWTRRMRDTQTESPDKERFLSAVARFNETGVWEKDSKKK
jgi:hypothetical protein